MVVYDGCIRVNLDADVANSVVIGSRRLVYSINCMVLGDSFSSIFINSTVRVVCFLPYVFVKLFLGRSDEFSRQSMSSDRVLYWWLIAA